MRWLLCVLCAAVCIHGWPRGTTRRRRRWHIAPPTPQPQTSLQCRSNVADAKVVPLTEQNFKVDMQCAKFGALLSNQTCPEGYCITPGTLVNKRVYTHDVCVSVQTVLCQCGSTICPTATCKTYAPKIAAKGMLSGFTVDNSALYKATFSAQSHVNMNAAVESKVISTIKEWTQDFIKIVQRKSQPAVRRSRVTIPPKVPLERI